MNFSLNYIKLGIILLYLMGFIPDRGYFLCHFPKSCHFCHKFGVKGGTAYRRFGFHSDYLSLYCNILLDYAYEAAN